MIFRTGQVIEPSMASRMVSYILTHVNNKPSRILVNKYMICLINYMYICITSIASDIPGSVEISPPPTLTVKSRCFYNWHNKDYIYH